MSRTFLKHTKSFATKAIHAGQEPERNTGLCVVPPIILSTTYKQDAPGEFRSYDYSRHGNPTRSVLEECLAALEDAKYGLVFSSGLGATNVVLSLLKTGDHIVVGDDIYGGTNRLIKKISERLNLEPTFVDQTDLVAFKAAIRPNTKLVWVETPTNPLLKIADIESISKICREREGIIFVVDNTFLTPYFQKPLEFGADISFYSLTKYMNGHTDVLMGGVTLNCDKIYSELKLLQNVLGIVPSPFDCYQVNRSLKTLKLRMEQHQANSIEVAKFLEQHEFIEKVLHPGLPSHPNHEIGLKQSFGHSGIFSFYLKGNLHHSRAFLKALKVVTLAASLGGYESSIALPSIMTHLAVPKEERENLGITDSLIRVSIGLEDVDDLVEDFKNALKVAQNL